MKAKTRFVLVNADNDSDLDVTPSALGETDPKRTPTHEEISVAAHQMYEAEGCPGGLAEDHWYTAERLLIGEG